MLKVLIVDDDSVARTNIKTLIDWNKNGFDICGEEANGANAIETIKSEAPDIVITDMSMPVMDGVALIGYIEQKHPAIKAIALSGYNDFDYVRQSMKKGAVDYILKHTINPDILLEVLNNTKNMILQERQQHTQKTMLQEELKQSRAVLRQNFIKQLVQGAINEKMEIEQKINSLGMELDTRNLAVVACEVDDFILLSEKFSVKEVNKLISSVIDISAEVLKGTVKAVVSHLEGGKFVIIFSLGNMRSNLYIYNHIITAVDRIKVSIKRYLNITACFSLSKVFNDITEINSQYIAVEKALEERFFKGKDKIIEETSKRSEKSEFYNLDIKDEKNIIAALKEADGEKLKECIDTIFSRILESKQSYNSIQMICAELINIVSRVAKEVGIDIKVVYNDNEIPYEGMKKLETISEVIQWIFGVYDNLLNLIEQTKINPNYSEYTKKVIGFIQRNYPKNISLNEAADYIGVNSSYLSRIFKEDCGMGFVEYLNNVRVNKAKRAIETGDLKLRDIVKEVGFNSYTYFFKVFKDIINMTPLEYEKECRTR